MLSIQNRMSSSTHMLFTGWEVRIGRNCARGLEYRPRPTASGGTQTEGKVSPNTNRPRPVNNIFIFSTKFQENFTSASKLCDEVGPVRFDEARDRLQTKTKHYSMTFNF